MKILILTTKPPWPPHDGGAVATKCIIEGLTSHGADISVISIMTQKHNTAYTEFLPEQLPVTTFKTCAIDTTIKPLALLSNLLFSDIPYDIKRFRSENLIQMIRSLPDIDQYDIIQCEGLAFALYAGVIRSLSHAPLVHRALNIEHQIKEMMADNEQLPPKRWYLRNLSRRIRHLEKNCRNIFDAIITITDDDKRWFEAQDGKATVMSAEAGAPLTTGSGRQPKRDNRVGFIGALDWQPNIRGLQWFINEVWPSVVTQIPEASFTIAGRNASRHTIKSLKGTNVIFEGEINVAVDFTSSMTVMVAPLFAGSGMRIKIIEAMSTGVPVVASPVAAKGIAVTDKKDILLADNKEAFATAVCCMLKDSREHDRIAANAQSLLKEKYDNSSITAHLLSFYQTLTNDR